MKIFIPLYGMRSLFCFSENEEILKKVRKFFGSSLERIYHERHEQAPLALTRT